MATKREIQVLQALVAAEPSEREEQVERYLNHETTLAECEREMKATMPDGWATSGTRQEGESWECSCGRVFVHVCDEAEGCYWLPEEE